MSKIFNEKLLNITKLRKEYLNVKKKNRYHSPQSIEVRELWRKLGADYRSLADVIMLSDSSCIKRANIFSQFDDFGEKLKALSLVSYNLHYHLQKLKSVYPSFHLIDYKYLQKKDSPVIRCPVFYLNQDDDERKFLLDHYKALDKALGFNNYFFANKSAGMIKNYYTIENTKD